MIPKPAHFHVGLDHRGHRHLRLRSASEALRTRERRRLRPAVVLVLTCQCGQAVWRNGMQRRRWLELTDQSRGDRRCFLMTLRHPPLVQPLAEFRLSHLM